MSFRSRFHLPADKIYLCGNSLGPQPKAVADQIDTELRTWRERAVEGWWDGPEGGWLVYAARARDQLAQIVGARPEEVTVANALTVNLHLLLVSFFRPEGRRRKVIMEAGAFPSDQHAIISQLRFHGLDPGECLIEVAPREGEWLIRTEDIVQAIHEAGDELALVLWSGVHYYTGQFFALAEIAAAGRSVGAKVGLDLAHAAGNVPLSLHDWGVDFAVWCSYKYLNAGPGAPGGLFVHARYAEAEDLPRFAGWWGHRQSDRFQMRRTFRPERGAAGWEVSTVPVLGMAPLLASLSVFREVEAGATAGAMNWIREQSKELTGTLYELLDHLPEATVITGRGAAERGAQLSVYLPGHRPDLEHRLSAAGLVVDYREDNLRGSAGGVLRLAPAPLYTRKQEVVEAASILEKILRPALLLILVVTLAACGAYPKLPVGGRLDPPPPPEYASPANWAALPEKEDMADRTPGAGFQDRQDSAAADVFYIHPTVYRKTTDWSSGWNATVYDLEVNESVDESAVLNQASIFNAAGRVYAPRYRQANIRVYYPEGAPMYEPALDLAYSDVLRAFDFYLRHYNDGRPIIIASHSQGTTHAKRLLTDRFDGRALKDRLVAAYLVGMPVSRNAYRTIPVCATADQTGCFVSWRTYRDDFVPKPGYRDTVPDIAVVNPLSWTTDTERVPAQRSKGGVLLNYDKGPKAELVSAQIRGGGLFTSKPRFFGDVFFRTKNYHIGDFNLFWVDVRENAVDRVRAYLERSSANASN